MVSKKSRVEIRRKKHMKLRNRFSGTAERPRLAVFRRHLSGKPFQGLVLLPVRAQVDYLVDRRQVQGWRQPQPSRTNRPSSSGTAPRGPRDMRSCAVRARGCPRVILPYAPCGPQGT